MSLEAKYTIEPSVGRLIEARVFGLATREDADAYSRLLGQVVSAMPRRVAPVLCADHRPVRIYPQPAADRLAELFTHMNGRLERIAILVSPTNATLGLQLDRIVREVKNDRRQAFRGTDRALDHLALSLEVRSLLDERTNLSTNAVHDRDAEMAQAARFLGQWTG